MSLGWDKFAKGFTNHEQTDPSGLIYMQARFYAPMYGRFLSPDPARDQHFEETQSWNIYSYVQNNPTMVVDPNGEAGILSGIWQGIKAAPGNWARSWGSAFKQDSTLRGYGSRVATSTLGPTGAAMLSGAQRGVALGKEMVQEAKTNGAGGVAKVLTREVGTEVINLAVSVGIAKGTGRASNTGAAPEATPVLNAAGEPAGVPGIIYRGGGSNPGNLTLRAGEEALSFRDGLSNPVGGPAVLRPGQPYIGVDASKLPAGSVVADGVAGSKATPPGHVSVTASPAEIQAAIIEKGKIPK